MAHIERGALASRIGALARRIETLIIKTNFPEMTADSPPVIFQLDSDPGDASIWFHMDDLTDAFDRLAPRLDILTAFDLGLRHGDDRHAA